tara:strand:+ start:4688 stop:5689 length:1002 start_codon:yes stop_codon:yes gene_type:complete
MRADIVVGVQAGDEAKGKVTHHLCKNGSYTHVLRFNGGCNAGHTIYHEGKKFITHHIPAGVFYGIKSVIGSGCVVNVKQFFKELEELKEGGIDVEGNVFIARNAHIITDEHLEQDGRDNSIGTTKRGNGPAYRDKYNRSGLLAKDCVELKPYLLDLYEEFHENGPVRILCEGAQGFELDIDWGDYPYVTSSHCTTAGALLNAIPYSWIGNVWGVAKIYETYVGAKKFEPDDPAFPLLRKYGEEFGATTGRPRQCNWLDLDRLYKAVKINGVNRLVINKMDVMRQLDRWTLIKDGGEKHFESEQEIKSYMSKQLTDPLERRPVLLYFSDNKHSI